MSENGIKRALPVGRRRLLTTTAAGIAAVSLGGGLLGRQAFAQTGTVRWISPRGTVEVLDDYAYWVAKRFGYFGDIETELEPGPQDGTATVKMVDQELSDMGYPSPGVFSLALEQGMPLVSVFQMGATDVFDMAFRKGEKPASITELAGKTVVLGAAAWQAITDPLLAQAGVDISSINYVVSGNWAQALAQGQGDSALSWEGLRAQWLGQGLDFDYFLGRDFSVFPANSFVIRRSDFEDASKADLYTAYLRGWAAGLEFGVHNPRAATQIVMEEFPGLASQMTPELAVESMMQLANVFRGKWEERQGWGWHDIEAWRTYLGLLTQIGQMTREVAAEDVIKNDYVPGANTFDAAKVEADAAGFALAPEYEAVDLEAIRARL